MNRILIFPLLVLSVFYAKAQYTQTIRGTVTDYTTKVALPGANVAITDADFTVGTTTSETGNFNLEQIPVGKHTLTIRFVGYEPKVYGNIELKSGKELVLDIELVEKVEKVEEITVTARKNGETRNSMAVLSARSFSVKETERYAGALGDPSRMASNFAGVITANDSRNDIIIRGNSPQGLRWRLEGVNIPNPNHYGALGSTGGPVSMLNSNMLANSDFFTGAFPAGYGNALAGVFDLKLRNGNNHKHEFTGQIGFNGFELGAEGPISKKTGASYMVNYRYSVLSVMDKLGFDVAAGAVPEYQDVSFKINLPTKNIGTFSMFGIGGNSFIQFDEGGEGEETTYNTSNASRTRNGSDMGVIALTHRIRSGANSNWYTTFSASMQQVQTQVDSMENKIAVKRFYGEKNREKRLNASTRYSHRFNVRNNINLGASFESLSIVYADSVTGEAFNPPSYGQYIKQLDTEKTGLNLVEAYGEWQHRVNDELTLYGGIHLHDFLFNATTSFDPRASISYKLPNKARLSLAYGKHSQIQPLYAYFVESHNQLTNQYAQTNNDLGFSKAHHFVAGFDKMIAPNLKCKIEGYYQSLFNIPVEKAASTFSMVNAGNSFHQERVDNLVNNGLARNIGAELTLEKYLDDNYYFLITTSLFDSKYQGSDKVWRNTEFNTNYIVNALGGYEIPISNNVSIDMNLRTVWSGGKRNQYIDLEQSRQAGSTVFDHSKDYQTRENDYFRLDFRASIVVNKKKITQEWALDVTNLTNHKNVFSSYYSNEKQSIEYIYQQMRFPMFLYRINF